MVYIRSVQRRHEQSVSQAWVIAALSRVPREQALPPLAKLLGGRAVAQTPEEQREMWHYIADAIGSKVRRHKPSRYRIIRPSFGQTHGD